MIEKGDYSFEVMNDETGQAFKEHNKDGISYVEVEPDVQYFIRFKNNSSNDVIIHGFIDGGDLGYSTLVRSKLSTDIGFWSVQGNVSETKSLKFAKFSRMPEVKGSKTDIDFFGSFKFDIYSVLYETEHDSNKRHKTEFKSNWESKLEDIPSEHGGDKRLHTEFGDKTLSTCSYRGSTFYKGKHIETVEIKYGTTFGLAYKGVLPPLPNVNFNWNKYARLNRGPKYKSLIKPEIGCLNVQLSENNVIFMTAALFDLSKLSDDEPTVEEISTMEETDPHLIKEETMKLHESLLECFDFAKDPNDKLTQYVIHSKDGNKKRKVRVKNFGLIQKCIPHKIEDGDHNN